MSDTATIGIPCPKCGHKTQKSIGWIKANKEFVCVCGRKVALDADHLLGEIAKAEKALTQLKESLKKFKRK